jgi:hypothetical protein
MEGKAEKRNHEREGFCVDLYYAFSGSSTCFGARSINTSKGGMCFQTGYAIAPGKKITLYYVHPAAARHGNRRTTGQAAEVKWCRTLPEYHAFFYQVGVVFR